jgi:hypothetical protein
LIKGLLPLTFGDPLSGVDMLESCRTVVHEKGQTIFSSQIALKPILKPFPTSLILLEGGID